MKKKQKGANTFVPGGELAKQQAQRRSKKDVEAIKVRKFVTTKIIEESKTILFFKK